MKTHAGFTLIELMLTITVAAILVGVGLPGFQELMRNNRRASNTNEIVAALNTARSEAVKRNTAMALCPSTNGTSCSGGKVWETGWIVFVDDGDITLETGEEIIAASSGVPGITLRSTFTGLGFRPNGRMRTSASADQAEFIICDDQGVDKASTILISISGRPQSAKTDLNNSAPSSCTP